MFTWLNKQGVRSDCGFEVQFTGRFDAEYREGGKTVSLYVESGYDEGMRQCVLVDPGAFEYWDDGQSISSEKREKILKNLSDAMEFQGLKLVVQKGETPMGCKS